MQKHHVRLCVFFTIIVSMIAGCGGDNITPFPYDKRIDNDTVNSPYQFMADSFVPNDIKTLKKNNLDLKIAQNRITQSQALYTQAFAGYLPQITADISGNKQISNQTGGQNAFVMRPQGNLKFYSFNSQISFVPDFFGRTKLRTLMADNQIQANYLLAESTYLQILNGYAKNYHLVCATQSLLNVHKNMVTLNKNILQSAKIRYELGRTNIVDYYNAQDSLLSAKIDLNKAKQNHNLALKSYYSLIGESIGDTDKTSLCKNGFAPLPHKKLTIHLQTLDNRPDIKAIQYSLKNAYHTLDLSLKAIYPDITILFTAQNFSKNLSDVLDVNRFIGNFVAQISQLIYDGGVRDANIDIAKSDAVLLKQTYYNSVLTAGNDLITLGKNFKLIQNLEHQAQTRVQTAHKALDAAERNYKMGNIGFTQLINSQRNYYIAQTEYIITAQNMRNLYGDIVTNSGVGLIKM